MSPANLRIRPSDSTPINVQTPLCMSSVFIVAGYRGLYLVSRSTSLSVFADCGEFMRSSLSLYATNQEQTLHRCQLREQTSAAESYHLSRARRPSALASYLILKNPHWMPRRSNANSSCNDKLQSREKMTSGFTAINGTTKQGTLLLRNVNKSDGDDENTGRS